jgi:hypothetical protein
MEISSCHLDDLQDRMTFNIQLNFLVGKIQIRFYSILLIKINA